MSKVIALPPAAKSRVTTPCVRLITGPSNRCFASQEALIAAREVVFGRRGGARARSAQDDEQIIARAYAGRNQPDIAFAVPGGVLDPGNFVLRTSFFELRSL